MIMVLGGGSGDSFEVLEKGTTLALRDAPDGGAHAGGAMFRPMRAALFATCLADRFFAEACADAVRLLRHLGVDVDVPTAQTCCGQPAYNSGHRPEALRMARHTLGALADAPWVVVPSGSCAAMIRRFLPRLLEGSEREAAEALGARTRELSSFIVDVLGIERLGRGLEGRRLAYHHGCHALRELGVSRQPVALLEGAGAEVVAWAGAEDCCGFGGLFAAKLPAVSTAMADDKLEGLPPDVDAVVSADGGCLLQLSTRAARTGGRSLRFEHLASTLFEAVEA